MHPCPPAGAILIPSRSHPDLIVSGGGHVVVIGTTHSPEALDPAFRRPGRFDLELAVPVPDGPARSAIAALHARNLPLAADVDLAQIASSCYGYSGADLAALCREAALSAVARSRSAGAEVETGRDLESEARSPGHTPADAPANTPVLVTADDFVAARTVVGPSIARGLALDFVPVQWSSIGGLAEVKLKLQQAVEWPIRRPEALRRLGLRAPKGVLLHGPPGCSKTTLARAAATASGATFVALSAAQLFSQYVGEGEAILRAAFARARLASPAILFLDEIDALAGRRADDPGRQHASASRILSTFLTEMDGLEGAKGAAVLVLGATNRPGAIDDALLRPGRFDLLLHVPSPDLPGRRAVLGIHAAAMPLAADVDLDAVAARTARYTGAELAQVCREAAMAAIRERPADARVAARHFDAARLDVRPALSEADLAASAAWRRRPAR